MYLHPDQPFVEAARRHAHLVADRRPRHAGHGTTHRDLLGWIARWGRHRTARAATSVSGSATAR